MNAYGIDGLCPPRFDAVRDAFGANFAQGHELGARFALAIEGEIVVDLMGGWADRGMSIPFGPNVLTPIFSTTKALASLMIAKLVGEGRLFYETRVAEVWPAFGAAGKGALTVAQVLSHQAGLCGLEEPMTPADWFDWDGVCERLAAMTPLWPPASASGYHPVTFGYLTGEMQTPNCYGEQKVLRLNSWLAERFGADLDGVELYAYGDTRGDLPLLRMAQHAWYRGKPWT